MQKAKFDAEEVLHILNKYPVSVLCAPPTAYRAMVQCGLAQYPFHSLRHCVSAGEPLNPEIMETWTKITGIYTHNFLLLNIMIVINLVRCIILCFIMIEKESIMIMLWYRIA